jgi:hypothetical protein
MKRLEVLATVLAVLSMVLVCQHVRSAPYATGTLVSHAYALPVDQDQLYLTVVGEDGHPVYQHLCQLFQQHPQFIALKADTHYHELGCESTMYASRYSHDYHGLPAVRLQAPSGEILWECSGEELSQTELFAEIEAECIRWRQRSVPYSTPQPMPRPVPRPAPRPVIEPDPIDHTPVTPQPTPTRASVWYWVVCGVLGVAGAVYSEWQEVYRQR